MYSTDTKEEIITYELEGDFEENVISSLILTRKHLLLFYRNGRIEWVNKFYPDAMEEESIQNKPFYLDKYYECENKINCALYDHMFENIYIANSNGFFTIMPKVAENNEVDEEDEENKHNEQKDYERDKKL